MIVECASVHQHFNDDPDNEAILLVFKAKPLFLFMHLLEIQDAAHSLTPARFPAYFGGTSRSSSR
jgi:hypothetical protein